MDVRLDGKSALITGGSEGLGKAMAIKFADAGADVAILARSVDKLEKAHTEIDASGSGKVLKALKRAMRRITSGMNASQSGSPRETIAASARWNREMPL